MKQEAEIEGKRVLTDGEFTAFYLDRKKSFAELGKICGHRGRDGVRQRASRLGLTPATRVPDDEFKALYLDTNITLRDVARECGYYDGTQILKRAAALGLPRNVRPKSTTKAKASNIEPAEVKKEEIKCPEGVAGAPYWTPKRDAMVWAARHNHAKLSALAAKLKQPITRVQQRHHQLIAASGIKVW